MFKNTSNYSSGESKTVGQSFDLKGLGKSHVERAIKAFLQSPKQNAVIGSYFIQDGTLSFREASGVKTYRLEMIAIHADGLFVGNSTASNIQLKVGNVTKGQEILISLGVPMVPFNAFLELGLDIREFKMIDQGPSETVKRLEPNPAYLQWRKGSQKSKAPSETVLKSVHFIGASLFSVGGKCFLFDIDRVEIENGLFNPFLTEIPKRVHSIAAAYDALIPAEVREAMSKGLDVKRQGEWFLIPVKGEFQADLTPKEDIKWLGKYRPLTIRAGKNRPNTAQYGVEARGLVKGKFEHTGREHKTIVLEQWHKAVPNTAIGSFTITGDID